MANLQERLKTRRNELGIPFPDLAARSGVSIATVKRILGGSFDRASFKHVAAIATAMGLDLDLREHCSARQVKERVAKQQAMRLVNMVQGTSALESQAVSSDQLENMVSESFNRLMAGPSRRVWAQ
jgi:transcriptional regulator with XRE-family HTH domain